MSRSRPRAALAVLLVLILATVFLSGPKVPVETAPRPLALPADLDAYLAAAEARFPDLRPGTEKTIVWAGEAGAQTPLALVALHGFSASRQETAPFAERVAARLGANLFATRFTGHGLDGAALAAASVGDWLHDAREAVAIGTRIGEQVALLGVSTGGTVATWLATQPESAAVCALVLMSPNFGLPQPAAELLTWPWGATLAQVLLGQEHQFEPANPQQARYWTTRYPSVALLPMMAMVRLGRDAAWQQPLPPTLVLYSPRDRVVDPRAIERAFVHFDASEKRLVAVARADEKNSHLLAGDILVPQQTEPLAALTAETLRQFGCGL